MTYLSGIRGGSAWVWLSLILGFWQAAPSTPGPFNYNYEAVLREILSYRRAVSRGITVICTHTRPAPLPTCGAQLQLSQFCLCTGEDWISRWACLFHMPPGRSRLANLYGGVTSPPVWLSFSAEGSCAPLLVTACKNCVEMDKCSYYHEGGSLLAEPRTPQGVGSLEKCT